MKKLNKVVTPLIAVAMMAGGWMISPAQGFMSDNSTKSSVQDWQKAPAGVDPKGYQDGVQAMQLDALTHRPIDFKLAAHYKNPPVKTQDRPTYQAAFEAGYKAAMQHPTTN